MHNYKIYYAPGSFKINKSTKAINGFTSMSLQDGRPYNDVIQDIITVMQGKLVIFCGVYGDMKSMGLSASQFDVFDLQQYWKECTTNKEGVDVEQSIGLKHIYYKYFGRNIQDGTHDAMKDAVGTMRIFREIYMKLDNPVKNPDVPPFRDFPRVLNV
jgi:hypothetical protein